MSTSTAYDLVIIGAGSVGVPAALFTARAGMRTLVLDRRASVGQGDNKRAIGGVRATHSDPAKISICLRSIEIFRDWEAEEGDYLGYHRGGYLFPVYREGDETLLKGLLEVQHQYGLSIDWISPDRVSDIVPGIRLRDLRGGTYSPEDITVSPLRSIAAFHRAAVAAGAEFRFLETVTGVETQGGKVTAVTTDQASYPCANVLNAAGAKARDLGAWVGLDLPVYPDSHEAGITEPVERFFDPLVVDIRPTPGAKNCYFFQNSKNRIEFCLTPDPIIPGTACDATSSFLPLVAQKMCDLLPRLSTVRVRRMWRGLYPQTPDGSPIVGSCENPAGYHFAVGMCGQGFMLGPGLAQDLVGMIRDGKTVTPPDVFALFRLDRDFGKTEALK
jgi:sarcosine oxidase subunit beta